MRHFRIYVFFLSTLLIISCGAEEKDKKTPQPVTEEEKKTDNTVYLNRNACEEAHKNGKYHFMIPVNINTDGTRERKKICILTNSFSHKKSLEFLSYKTVPSCQSTYLGCAISSDEEGIPHYTFFY